MCVFFCVFVWVGVGLWVNLHTLVFRCLYVCVFIWCCVILFVFVYVCVFMLVWCKSVYDLCVC